MIQQILQILSAGLAGSAFAMIFHIRPRYLPLIFTGSCLSWIIYLTAEKIFDNRAGVMIVAAAGLTLYSEIFARIVRLPVSVIYTPIVIPLIPGSHLYYCMRGFVTNSRENFIKFGILLLEDSLGIVLGSIIVLTFFSAVTSMKRKRHKTA